jgi:dihydroorotate dehydrogenase (NAD+) catalytic subunit
MVDKIDLSTSIGNVTFKNPVLTASGTFGYGLLMNELFDISLLGGIITKSITIEPRSGNAPPRIVETSCGMLNSIGLENKGIEHFIQEILPAVKELKTHIIASIAGSTDEEFGMLAEQLNDKVSALEVNISCPNVREGGMSFGQDLSATERVVQVVKEHSSLPVIAKLTPNVTRIEEFAMVCEESGADAISLVNTYKGLSVNISERRSDLGGFTGGLSGPAIKPLALFAVWNVSQHITIPVIGCGGITTWSDAVEFLMAGASLIEIGSATFREPDASLKILEGIKQFMVRERIKHIKEIVGVVRDQ